MNTATETFTPPPPRQDVWKWMATTLGGLALGGLLGTGFSVYQSDAMERRMLDHERTAGHPLMIERVNQMDRRIDARLAGIEQQLREVRQLLAEKE